MITLVVRMVGALRPYWFHYDQTSWRRWCDVVIPTDAKVAPRSREGAVRSRNGCAERWCVLARSGACLREALAIYQTEEVLAGQAASLYWLGRALSWDPEHGEDYAIDVTRCFDEGLQLCLRIGDSIGASWCRVWLGIRVYWKGDLVRAEQLARQVVHDSRMTNALHPRGQALASLANIERRRGHNDSALEFLQEAVGV